MFRFRSDSRLGRLICYYLHESLFIKNVISSWIRTAKDDNWDCSVTKCSEKSRPFFKMCSKSNHNSFFLKNDVFQNSPTWHQTLWLLFQQKLSPRPFQKAKSGHTDSERPKTVLRGSHYSAYSWVAKWHGYEQLPSILPPSPLTFLRRCPFKGTERCTDHPLRRPLKRSSITYLPIYISI